MTYQPVIKESYLIRDLSADGYIDLSSIHGNYWSAYSPGEYSASIAGPAQILCGVVGRTGGYAQISTNNVDWSNIAVSSLIGGGDPGNDGDEAISMIQPMYVPEGVTFYIRVGSTFSGSSSQIYGGAFIVRYLDLS